MSLFGGHRLGPVSTKIFDSLCEAQKSRNLDNNLTHKLRLLLEQNEELEDVHEEKNRMRFKTEDGKLGKAAIDNCQNVMRNMKPVLLPILAVTSEKFDEMISVLGKELEDNDSYLDISRVYGRKKGNI
ncbi:13969_t:CDS:2 [Acaulospora morrowiae]|uniref:13969_t:CDS:1 n=1 Tax=Acaulospora morrowiae TaxID=94023 RepID=A0A9N8WDT7_9GLOM|nr:13969_t:CDS:2 [Acaulospora morrowiae]